jgi:CubicO group peptidase (beta-lactamase class C family)
MTTVEPTSHADLTEALFHLDRFVAASMQAQATPGLALAITDRERLLATRNYGLANLEAQLPVTDDTLFEFGSIGKSFTAVCLLQLADAGVIDLQAPVTTYLTWFSVRSQYEPITLHHLLSHTSGLICGTDFAPDQRYEVWALRDTEAAQPGVRARYSNVGYKVLSLVLEAVTGTPYGQLVAEGIFAPLEMRQSASAITHAMRHRLAVGYTGLYSDRPWHPSHGFVPAVWLETNTGDGSLAATAADLAIFLRMLLNDGAGPRGRVLSAESFARMSTPHGTFSYGAHYGYGLFVGDANGHRRIGHEGGMVGFSASMLGDRDTGIGVVVLTNAIQETDAIAEFALQSVSSALAGAPLPAPDPLPVIDFMDYVGAYQDGTGAVTVDIDDGQVTVLLDDARVVLDPLGSPPEPDHFLAQDAEFALVPFRFQRDETGRVEGLVHGARWFPTDDYQGPTEFSTPAVWDAFPGHYRNYNPWNPEFRVVVRQGALWLIHPWGAESQLFPEGEGFRLDDEPEGPESFLFDTVVDGQALRVRCPGGEAYYRFFTP